MIFLFQGQDREFFMRIPEENMYYYHYYHLNISVRIFLKMTSTQVIETSVTTNNSPSQDYTNPDNQPSTNKTFFFFKGWYVMFFACEVKCIADVRALALRTRHVYEGITPAIHQPSQAIKHTISTLVEQTHIQLIRQRKKFFEISLSSFFYTGSIGVFDIFQISGWIGSRVCWALCACIF